MLNFQPQRANIFWNKRFRTANHHLGTQLFQAQYIRKCYPGVKDVTYYNHLFTCHIAQLFAYGNASNKAWLGWSCAPSLAFTIWAFKYFDKKIRRPHRDGASPPYPLSSPECCLPCRSCFALAYRWGGCSKIHGVGRQASFSQLKRQTCTGGILEKYIGNGNIPQGMNFFNRSV